MRYNFQNMDDFKQGIVEVLSGLIGGIIYSAFLAAVIKDKTIPGDLFWILPLISLAGTVSTIFVLKAAGFMFNLGCIFGALILMKAMDTGTFLLYFGVPLVVLIVRIFVLIKSNTD
jgi:hypothetical protein